MMRKLLSFFPTAMLLCLCMVSCMEDPADSPLTGQWRQTKSNGTPVAPAFAEAYTFDNDGSGFRSFFEGSVLRNEPFDWASFGGNLVELTYYDGATISYYYRFSGSELELSESSTFRYYNSYRRN